MLNTERLKLINRRLGLFVSPDTRPTLNLFLEKVFESESQETCELCLLNDGNPLYVLLTGIITENKELCNVTMVNITEHKLAEEALRESKILLNATQQISKVGGWKWNVENQSMYWTDETYRIHEIDKNKIEAGSTEHIELSTKCYDEKDRLIIKAAFQKCVDEGIAYDFEFPFTTVKGNRIWVRTIAQREKENNKVLAVVGNIIDITERKQAEEALQESEEKYRIFFENNDAIILFVNPDNGEIIFSNKAAAKYYGYTREQLTGLNISKIHTLNPGEIKLKIADARKRNQNYFLFKHKLADGEIRDVEVYQSKLFMNNKDVFSIIVHDITERRNAEINLNLALQKAEESDRLKTAFLANMSHEIRTPMNGILGFASLLKEPELAGDVQQKYIGIIEKSGIRMLNIINDLIDISKVEAGQMEVLISESNINEQVEYIYTFFKPEVERKGMQLFFKNPLTVKEAVVKTDREKIFAILTNLVKNAIKYSDKGTIELGCEKKDKLLEFYVKDTGIGIPKDKLQAIFDRFVQVDISDERAFQGAGLGLAITKAYVEMLGGRIWVESETGVGSQFYFTIPYSSGESETEPASVISGYNAVPEPQIKKLKILIAEDEETADLYLTLVLKKFGNEILHVKTGEKAVEVCQNNPDIDLILMDIQMPVMGGYEATQQIRKFNKDVVIIAQTAFGLFGDREKTIDAGCNDYISKPINKFKLIEMIGTYFRE